MVDYVRHFLRLSQDDDVARVCQACCAAVTPLDAGVVEGSERFLTFFDDEAMKRMMKRTQTTCKHKHTCEWPRTTTASIHTIKKREASIPDTRIHKRSFIHCDHLDLSDKQQ